MLNKRILLALALSCLSSATLAESLTAIGYSYPFIPSFDYPDSGNELLDGFINPNGWGNSIMNSAKAAPYTGAYPGNISVIFNFDGLVRVDSVTIYADDADGAAGVWFPSSASISMGGTSFANIPINDPLGSSPTAISFTNLGLVGDTLNLRISNPDGWIMLSEVQFTGTPVPIPAAVWLFGSALAGLAGLRRRRKSV